MHWKKRLQWVGLLLALTFLFPLTSSLAGDRGPEAPIPEQPPADADGLWIPRTPEEKAIFDDIHLPDAATIAEAQREKLRYVPITAEQSDRWDKALEAQMQALMHRLPEKELASLDIDSLAAYIDMQALFAASGIDPAVGEVAKVDSKSNVNLGVARHGDFLLGHNGWRPWGYWNHAAMWDAYHGNSKTLHARGYGWGVRHDASNWFRTHYRKAAVMGVWTSAYVRYSAGWYARAQVGEPYTIWTSKTNQSRWYCSKLVWASYYWRSGRAIDLDSNGGYWVTPNNLWYSGWTYIRSIG